MPKAIDLFAGCGGLSLGLKNAGFNVLGAVEIDLLAVETYQANHPEVLVWHRDIRALTAPRILKTLGLKSGELDLLAGCPPCQGFSAMRRLNGARRVRDRQNDLVFDFLRLAKGLRPRAIMMENVPGMFINSRFRKLKLALQQLGYTVNVAVKDAQNYGVPQRRRRFILLAGRGSKISFPKEGHRLITVRDAFLKLQKTMLTPDPMHNETELRSRKVMSLIRSIPENGGGRLDLPFERQLKCHRKCDGFRDVYGRMAWEKVAPTITGGCINPSKGRFLHPEKDRAITLREAALLQGFPSNYYFSLRRGKYAAAELIGNAVPPPFSRMQAKSVREFLSRPLKS